MVDGRHIKIYVEGGSKGKLFRECKEGFGRFLERAGLIGKMPKIIPCGSRNDTYKDFCIALKNSQPGDLPLLLVDSEGPITVTSNWLHVLQRQGDGWTKPVDANDDHLHFMTQVMESWFLADRAVLSAYFSPGFKEGKLPKGNELEAIPKLQVLEGLKAATKECGREKTYHKGRHSFEILGEISPQLVATASMSAKRLIDQIKTGQ